MLKQVTKQLALQGVRNFSVSQQVSHKQNRICPPTDFCGLRNERKNVELNKPLFMQGKTEPTF